MLMIGTYDGRNAEFDKIKLNGVKTLEKEEKKTSGWINRWLNYFFDKYIDIIADPEEKRIELKKYFPELFNTLQTIENMI